MKPIDFFIIGVQKGGTTALDTYLRRSPAVQMAGVKEVHFFDNESLDWDDPGYQSLHAHFDWSRTFEGVRGEATPIYIYWPQALERIRRYNPASKLILLLRHPAYRAHSHWRMLSKRGTETLSFEDAISEAGRSRVRAGEATARVFSYVERGFYAWQIQRLKELFPPEQLLFLRTDDLWARTEHTLGRVQAFLRVEMSFAAEQTYIVPLHSHDIGAVADQSLRRLNNLFAEDIEETSHLTNLVLDDWLGPAYREPMAPNHAE